MAKCKADVGVDYGAEVTRIYGVVPRPRYRDCPEAWARTKRPGKWREYYGYRYNPEARVPEAGKPGDKFPGAAVAAAMVAHSELARGRHLARVPLPRGRNGVDYHVTVREPAPIAPPEPVEAPPVRETPAPLPEPTPAPIVAPEPPSAPAEALPACTCEHDRLALAAAVLRELAGAYGPRRAHKLQAMADFVAAHGQRAA